MLESNPEQDSSALSDLGPVPDDFRALVTRTLGDRPITVASADELLAELGDASPVVLPPAASSFGTAPASVAASMAASVAASVAASPGVGSLEATPAATVGSGLAASPAAAFAAAPSPVAAFSGAASPAAASPGAAAAPAAAASLGSAAPAAAASFVPLTVDRPKSDESTMPMFTEPPVTADRAEVAQVFESRPAPSPLPPPLFDARPAPSGVPEQNVFDEPPPEDEESPDREAQAQAIEAAFDVNDTEPPGRAQQIARKLRSLLPPALIPGGSRPPRGGSRRPDLEQLLDQPLDALDFERSEAAAASSAPPAEVSPSVAPTPPPMAATPAPPAGGGDDFEILVDDEILEIAEDDVEIVDDEK